MSPSSETDKPPGQSRTINQSAPDQETDSFFVNSASKAQRRIPQWLDHFNMKDLKILIKTSLAVWITTIFIFINPTLDFLGQAAFFAW